MVQLVSDDFNRADAASLGGDWTDISANGFSIASNRAQSEVTGDQYSRYTGAAWTGGNDHYAECKVIAETGSFLGPCARIGSSGATLYVLRVQNVGSSGTNRIYEFGGFTSVATWVGTISATDVVRIECEGTDLRIVVNGTTQATGTNATATAGNPGILANGSGGATSQQLDDFAAGDFTSGGAITGTADLVFGGTNTLTGAGALLGTAALAFTGTNALTGAGALAGSAALIFAGTNALTGAGALLGTSVLTLTPTGSLASGAIAGTAILEFGGSAVLTGAGSLAGTSAQIITLTGALSGGLGIDGTVAISFAATGTLLGSGALVGEAALLLSGQGALFGFGAMAGSSDLSLTAAVFMGDPTPPASRTISVNGPTTSVSVAGPSGVIVNGPYSITFNS